MTRPCEQCRRPFVDRRRVVVFCSDACGRRHWLARVHRAKQVRRNFVRRARRQGGRGVTKVAA